MKIVRYILLLVLTALLVAGVMWANKRAGDELCTKVVVEVTNADSTAFVTPVGILQSLKAKNFALEGKPLWQINAEKVEKSLSQLPYVENVECVKTTGGVVVISVKQLVPVMRVFDGDKSYYVNAEGKQMAAAPHFFCDVPIVNGHFTKSYPPQRLLPLINYVNNDAALNALVAMYEFHDSTNIIIVPNIVGHVINFGDINNIENKFKKLLLFYKKVMPEKGWNTYDTISVKWDYQVVASLHNERVHTTVVDTTLDETTSDVSWINNENAPTAAQPEQKPAEAKKEQKPKAPEPKSAEEPKKADKKADKPQKAEPDKKADKAKKDNKQQKKKN